MPIARFQMPDGRVARFEVPDGTTPEQAHSMIAQAMGNQPKPHDPTEGMGTGERLLAGIGQGMSSAGRALLQGISKITGADSVGAGLVKQSEIDDAKALDAPLLATRAGSIGSGLGKVAMAAPTALIPGANTYAGAALIGGGTGAALTEGDAAERAKAALGGAIGGAAGKGLGDLLGWGIPKAVNAMRSGREAAQVANAQRDAAAIAAREAGYVVPPADVNPSMLNEMLGGVSGKIKTAQAASAKNQDVTNALARKALGLPEDAPLTAEALDAIRKQAGQAYADVSKLGAVDATKATLPAGVKVTETNSPLLFGKQKSVDMGDVVNAWRQNNADATAYFRSYARTADPETLTKARAAAAAAKALDEFMTTNVAAIQKNAPQKAIADLASGKSTVEDFLKQTLSMTQKGDLVESLKAARQQIAKSYTVEKALNGTTGDVSAQVLAKELAKGKPLSGDLLTAAQVAQAFPKATQSLKEAPKAWSPLDIFAGGAGAGMGSPGLMALAAARPGVRSLLLSKPYQGLMAGPQSYAPGLLETALPALDNELVRRSLPFGGGLLGIQLSQ